MNKEYRVRMSAEGQQEIIKAFQRVQQEATKSKTAAQEAGKGFDQLRESVSHLAEQFVLYEASLKVFELVKGSVESSIEFAAGMGKLQEKTGLSATALQVWAAAAKRVDVDQQTVSKGLGLFAKAMGNLQQGSTKASTSLKILLGSADALKGLNTDEKLRKITDGLAKMSASSQKAKITTDLFGKAGLELLPVIDQLGGEGFDKLKDKLEAFGALLTDDAIQKAKVAEETFGDLRLAAQGLGAQFTEGLLDPLVNVAGALASLGKDAKSTESPIQKVGAAVGETAKKMIFAAAWVGIYAKALINTGVVLAQTANKMLSTWHPFRDFPKIAAEYEKSMDQVTKANKAAQTSLFEAMNEGDLAEAMEKTAAKLKAAEQDAEVRSAAEIAAAERLAKARLSLTMANAQAILAVDRETNRDAAEFEKERFALGVESATRYYQVRRDLAAALALEEKNALAAQIAAQEGALKRENDPAKKVEIEKEIVELKAKAAELQIKTDSAHMTSILEEAAERKRLETEALSFEDKMLEAEGKRHAIDLAAIEHEAEAYRKVLVMQGDPNADAKTERFKKEMTAQADYKEANRQLEESEKKLGEARRKVDSEAERGNISQKGKKQELIAIDQQWQPVLEKQLATLRQIAKTSGLDPLIADADEAREKVDDLNASLNKTKDRTKDLQGQFAKSIGKDLHEFLTKGQKDSDDLGKSFEKLALGVAQDFVSMLSKMMANKSKDSGSGSDNSDGGGGGMFSFLQGFKPQQNDAGGEITYGPHGRDRVPSWLTRGEFVVRQPVVAQPGMRLLLHALNQGTLTPSLVKSAGPRFHAGGEVSGGFAVGGGQKSGKAELHVGLDHGLLLKGLSAHPDFGNIVVKHLGDNRKAANSALGK